MTRLLIIGAGGHGVVVAEAAELSGCWSEIAFLDDRAAGTDVLGYPILGGFSELPRHLNEDTKTIVAVGNNRRRIELLNTAVEQGARIATVVHPGAWISLTAKISDGVAIFAGTVVNARANIGFGSILNTGATIDHDCEIGEGAHISPGANLAGGVSVGERAWVGIGASVREGVRIGSDAILGAGAAAVGDVDSEMTVAGVPARELIKK